MTLLHNEIVVILSAYLLAGIPIGFAIVAGAWSPLYKQPVKSMARWWSWLALILVACAFFIDAVPA